METQILGAAFLSDEILRDRTIGYTLKCLLARLHVLQLEECRNPKRILCHELHITHSSLQNKLSLLRRAGWIGEGLNILQKEVSLVDYQECRKTALIRIRRSEFSAVRPIMELSLIERDGYICNWDGCDCELDLHVDHIIPLSKGGSDDLDNLQLLCKRHNCVKGTRVIQ